MNYSLIISGDRERAAASLINQPWCVGLTVAPQPDGLSKLVVTSTLQPREMVQAVVALPIDVAHKGAKIMANNNSIIIIDSTTIERVQREIKANDIAVKLNRTILKSHSDAKNPLRAWFDAAYSAGNKRAVKSGLNRVRKAMPELFDGRKRFSLEGTAEIAEPDANGKAVAQKPAGEKVRSLQKGDRIRHARSPEDVGVVLSGTLGGRSKYAKVKWEGRSKPKNVRPEDVLLIEPAPKVAPRKASAPKGGPTKATTAEKGSGPIEGFKVSDVVRSMARDGFSRLSVCAVIGHYQNRDVKNVPWAAWKQGLAGVGVMAELNKTSTTKITRLAEKAAKQYGFDARS